MGAFSKIMMSNFFVFRSSGLGMFGRHCGAFHVLLEHTMEQPGCQSNLVTNIGRRNTGRSRNDFVLDSILASCQGTGRIICVERVLPQNPSVHGSSGRDILPNLFESNLASLGILGAIDFGNTIHGNTHGVAFRTFRGDLLKALGCKLMVTNKV
jgi:hypothetical protein